jgi:protein TonB
MKKEAPFNLLRLVIFLLVGALHLVLLFLVVFHFTPEEKEPETPANVMRLADLEERPPPPPPPPPPENPPAPVPPAVTESLAEELIESDEVPAEETYTEPPPPAPPRRVTEGIDYLPQHQISVIPKFPEDKIRQAVVYPPIALRSGIEGRVFLELFIDPQGGIRQVRVLREEPPGRGFGEAAAKAFRDIRADSPALANGIPVAVRYRYALQFRIR